MDQRPTVQRESRRRRLLREVPGAGEADAAPGKKRPPRAAAPARRRQPYRERTLSQGQPRITDLVPRRPYGLLLVFLLAGWPLALVESLYVARCQGLPGIPAARLQSLALQGPGTVANWLSTVLLALTALLALLVFSVRRHRLDDYAGRYRLWLVVALALGVASLNVSTGLVHLVQAGLEALVGPQWARYPGPWAIWGSAAIVALLAIRVAVDLARSRGALLMVVLGMGCYFGSAAALLFPEEGLVALQQMWQGGLTLASHLAACLTLLVYARFICLEAGAASSAGRPRKEQEQESAAVPPAGRRRAWWPLARGRGAPAAARRPQESAAAAAGDRVEAAAEHADAEAGEEAGEEAGLLSLLGTTAGGSASAQRKAKKMRRQQGRRAA